MVGVVAWVLLLTGAETIFRLEPRGVTGVDEAEGVEVPTELMAETVKVYGVPLVRLETSIGEEVPITVIASGLEMAT